MPSQLLPGSISGSWPLTCTGVAESCGAVFFRFRGPKRGGGRGKTTAWFNQEATLSSEWSHQAVPAKAQPCCPGIRACVRLLVPAAPKPKPFSFEQASQFKPETGELGKTALPGSCTCQGASPEASESGVDLSRFCDSARPEVCTSCFLEVLTTAGTSTNMLLTVLITPSCMNAKFPADLESSSKLPACTHRISTRNLPSTREPEPQTQPTPRKWAHRVCLPRLRTCN